MHRALLVQELLRNILSYVESPASALALALTTHSLCDAALERVWSHSTAWDLAMTILEEFRRIQRTTDKGRLLVRAFHHASGELLLISSRL